jgi:hypothetical protein
MLGGALLTGRPAPIPFVVLLLGTIHAMPPGATALATPLYGSALLLAAELAYWSLDERAPQRVEAGVARRRLLAVLGVAIAAIPSSALVLAASQAELARSPAFTAAGAAALVACIALLAVLARRTPRLLV